MKPCSGFFGEVIWGGAQNHAEDLRTAQARPRTSSREQVSSACRARPRAALYDLQTPAVPPVEPNHLHLLPLSFFAPSEGSPAGIAVDAAERSHPGEGREARSGMRCAPSSVSHAASHATYVPP